MGYYIQTPGRNLNKAAFLVSFLGGKIIQQPTEFSEIPSDKALIVVVNNEAFEACGLAFSKAEFRVFTNPTDRRPKQFVLLDKELAYKEAGYQAA